MSKKTILVVDDEPNSLFVTSQILKDQSYQVITAESGNAALDILKDEKVNLVVTDERMPGLRGMDLFTDGWVDTAMNTLNQADQQMALLTNCIQNLNEYTNPLPRMWYFPDSLKSLVVLDNDGEDNNEYDFEQQFRDVDSLGAKMTIYVKDVEKV